nr:uncharacterized protein LOC115116168 [Oncorhynchus nerka]
MAKWEMRMDVLKCLAVLELDDMDSDSRGELDEMYQEIYDDKYGIYSVDSDSDSETYGNPPRVPAAPQRNQQNSRSCYSQHGRKKAPTLPTVEPSSTEMERDNTGVDGTVWVKQPVGNATGRLLTQNDTRVESGPTPYAKDRIDGAYASFHCLCDMEMLQRIRDCTVAEAHRVQGKNKTWDLSVEELEAFIAVLYVRGLHGNRLASLDGYWSCLKLDFFRDTMPMDRFTEILRYLRFDTREIIRPRTYSNKFAVVSEVWNAFVRNCIACYKPGLNITVEEQWIRSSGEVIKFALTADVDSKYVLNVIPYVVPYSGEDESQKPENVTLKLVEPYLGAGRTVTTDKFCTSLPLANKLIANKTNLVGAVSHCGRELPPVMRNQAQTKLYSTTVLKHDKATLTVYRSNPRKNVCILSTIHPTVTTGNDRTREPETVTFYNSNRVDVNTMTRERTVEVVTGLEKGGSHRWPLAVFFNLLDLAAINAYVLFTQCTAKTVPTRDFIMDLAFELREKHMRANAAPPPPLPPIQDTVCETKTHSKVRRSTRNKAPKSCG